MCVSRNRTKSPERPVHSDTTTSYVRTTVKTLSQIILAAGRWLPQSWFPPAICAAQKVRSHSLKFGRYSDTIGPHIMHAECSASVPNLRYEGWPNVNLWLENGMIFPVLRKMCNCKIESVHAVENVDHGGGHDFQLQISQKSSTEGRGTAGCAVPNIPITKTYYKN